MAKWVNFNGDGSVLTAPQQRMLGFAFRKIRPDIFDLIDDQQVFDAVCTMIRSSLLVLEFKVRSDGEVKLKWSSRVPQAADVRKLAEAQGIGKKAEEAKPIGTQSDDASE